MKPELDVELEKFRKTLGSALSEGGTQPLLRLTDEELAILDPESIQECIAPTPHLMKMEAEERDWALATALRSLVSRQVVEVSNIGELDALMRSDESSQTTLSRRPVDVDMRITPEVSLALTLRRTSSRALAAEQHTSSGLAHAFVYVHADDLYLVERVTAGGLHMFTLASTARDAAELVQLLVDPFDVADKDGPVELLEPEHLNEGRLNGPLNDTINNALVVGQIVALADAPGPLLTTYATDKVVWTVFVEKPNAPTGIQSRSVGSTTLHQMIAELVEPPARASH